MDQHNKMKAVFTVVEGPKITKGVWRRIGTAFVNQDESITILLDALPVNGRLVVREIESRDLRGRDGEGRDVDVREREVA